MRKMMGRLATFTVLALILAVTGASFTAPSSGAESRAGLPLAVLQDDDGNDDSSGEGGDDDGDDDSAEEAEDQQEQIEEQQEELEEEREEQREEAADDAEDAADDANDDGPGVVVPAAAYSVEVECTASTDANRTECTFATVAPAGGKKVSHLVIPDDVVCVGVRGGDFLAVDPDPLTNAAGYRATGRGPWQLVLDGEVTTSGSATYWLRAANSVFPATGLGLSCATPAAVPETAATATSDATVKATTESVSPTIPVTLEVTREAAGATFTPVPSPTIPAATPIVTGAVLVNTYACTGVPVDTSTFDWYGACEPGGSHRFVLAPDGGGGLLAADTVKAGEASFVDLTPGLYDLDDVNDRWCHAESDAVTAEGKVEVTAGAETTVWLFYCDE